MIDIASPGDVMLACFGWACVVLGGDADGDGTSTLMFCHEVVFLLEDHGSLSPVLDHRDEEIGVSAGGEC